MKNRNIVKQDFSLVNAKYKLDTNEIKFILTAIAQIKKEDEAFTEYEIKVSELEQRLQAEQNETRLKQFAKKLMSKPFEIEASYGWAVFNWFSSIKYIRGEAKFRVKIDDELKPYLLDLRERFVTYNLRYILPLTSSYSIRIYQMLKEYEKLKIRYIKVDELMDILQVPKSLKTYANFKNKVLKVAEKELLEHTDIYFTLEEEKEGKRVDRLIFRIYPNKYKEDSNQGTLFDVEPTSDYSKYYGKSVFVNGSKKEHITLITPMSDDSLIVKFKDNLELRFITENALKEKIF